MDAANDIQMREATEQVGRRSARGQLGERLIGFAFAAADVLVELDGLDDIQWADGRFIANFDMPVDGFIGRKVTALFDTRDQEVVGRSLLMVRNQGRIHPFLVRLSGKREIKAVFSALALPDENGRVLITLGLPPLELDSANAGMQDLDTLLRLAPNWLATAQGSSMELIDVRGGRQGVDPELDDLIETQLTQIVRHVLGASAMLAQLGRNRFAVLGPDMSQIDVVASTLEAQLRASPNGQSVKVGHMSIDLALDGLDARQATSIVRATLRGLAQAETLGPNGRRLSLAQMLGKLRSQSDRISAIISSRSFSLAYQPIVQIKSRRVLHYEALIRPHYAGTGYHTPGEFIAAAETLGLSEMVDLAVAETAMRQIARAGNLRVAVNVSAATIELAGFVDHLAKVAAAVKYKSGLMIEITETAEIANIAAARRNIEQLHGLGLPICLDDFGAGNASFRYLRELPVEYVKLDGSYTRLAVKNERERGFIHSILELSRTVGAKLIAEMVETEEEEAMLAALGVEFGQGWRFGRPEKLPLV